RDSADRGVRLAVHAGDRGTRRVGRAVKHYGVGRDDDRRVGLVDLDGHGGTVTGGVVVIARVVRRHVVSPGIGLVGNAGPIRVGRIGHRGGNREAAYASHCPRTANLVAAVIGERTRAYRRRDGRRLVDHDGDGAVGVI